MRDGRGCVQISDDWKFLSKVVDRILLYIYISACFVGGTAVMMSAPSLYDTSQPIDTNNYQQPVAVVDDTDSSSSSSSGSEECSHCQFPGGD